MKPITEALQGATTHRTLSKTDLAIKRLYAVVAEAQKRKLVSATMDDIATVLLALEDYRQGRKRP